MLHLPNIELHKEVQAEKGPLRARRRSWEVSRPSALIAMLVVAAPRIDRIPRPSDDGGLSYPLLFNSMSSERLRPILQVKWNLFVVSICICVESLLVIF